MLARALKLNAIPVAKVEQGFLGAVGIRRYLEPKLAEAFAKDGELDWDPFIEGQDELNISNRKIEGENTTITVQFQNFGVATRLRYEYQVSLAFRFRDRAETLTGGRGMW
jgi:hypothetical protein